MKLYEKDILIGEKIPVEIFDLRGYKKHWWNWIWNLRHWEFSEYTLGRPAFGDIEL